MDLLITTFTCKISILKKHIPSMSNEDEKMYRLRIARLLSPNIALLNEEGFVKYYLMKTLFLGAEILKKFPGKKSIYPLFAVLILTNSTRARIAAIRLINTFSDQEISTYINEWRDELLNEQITFKALGNILYDHINLYNYLSFDWNDQSVILSGLLEKVAVLGDKGDKVSLGFIVKLLDEKPNNRSNLIYYLLNQRIYNSTVVLNYIFALVAEMDSGDIEDVYKIAFIKSLETLTSSATSNPKRLKQRIEYFLKSTGYTCDEIFSLLSSEMDSVALQQGAIAIIDHCTTRLDRDKLKRMVTKLNSPAVTEYYELDNVFGKL